MIVNLWLLYILLLFSDLKINHLLFFYESWFGHEEYNYKSYSMDFNDSVDVEINNLCKLIILYTIKDFELYKT